MIAPYILMSIFVLSCHISCDESLSEAQIDQEAIDGFEKRIASFMDELLKIQWPKLVSIFFDYFTEGWPTKKIRRQAYLTHHCDLPETYFQPSYTEEPTEGRSECIGRHNTSRGWDELVPMSQTDPNYTSINMPMCRKYITDSSLPESCLCVCPKTTPWPNGSVTVADLINPFPNISQISIPWNLFERTKQTLGNDYLGTWQKARDGESKTFEKEEVAVDEVIKSYLILLLLPEYKKDPIGATNLYAYFQRKCSRNMPTLDRLFLLTAKRTYPEYEKTAVVDLHSCILKYWNRMDEGLDVCQVGMAPPCNCVCPDLAKAETHVFISANTLPGKETQVVIDVATVAYESNMDDRQPLAHLEILMNREIGGVWGTEILDNLAGSETISHPLEIRFSIKQEGKEPVRILCYRKN